MAALERRLDLDLAQDRHDSLLAELVPLVQANPLNERVRGQLMLALYRSGRQDDALRVFREGRRALIEQLGVEPTPALMFAPADDRRSLPPVCSSSALVSMISRIGLSEIVRSAASTLSLISATLASTSSRPSAVDCTAMLAPEPATR